MSSEIGPNIITNGLILCLDSKNTKSYPGTGTTWTDLSGNSSNLSLTGTYTYSANGFFSTNSADALGTIGNLAIVSNNFSYEIWAKPTATHQIDIQSTTSTTGVSGQKYLIGATHQGINAGSGISCGTNGISVYEHGDGYMPPLLVWSGTVSSTVFSHIVVVYTNKQPSLYLNNSLVATGLTSTKTSVFISNTIGQGSYGFFTGDIADVKYYNKSLTASEISQNYNALRGRYGI